MLKTVMSVVLVSVMMTSTAYAQQVISLSANESKSLTNHALWTLKATCHIQGGQTKHHIRISVLENKGQVNGKSLSKGQATLVHVNNADNISVSAEPGTTVHLSNLSNEAVEAICYI